MEYDPDRYIDADEWESTDDGEKAILVEDYHERAGFELPNARLHAHLHVIVENQVAIGDELPVKTTLDRLMAAGLGRHDAIHAIGSVLMKHMFDTLKTRQTFDDESYRTDLEELTAESCTPSPLDRAMRDAMLDLAVDKLASIDSLRRETVVSRTEFTKVAFVVALIDGEGAHVLDLKSGS